MHDIVQQKHSYSGPVVYVYVYDHTYAYFWSSRPYIDKPRPLLIGINSHQGSVDPVEGSAWLTAPDPLALVYNYTDLMNSDAISQAQTATLVNFTWGFRAHVAVWLLLLCFFSTVVCMLHPVHPIVHRSERESAMPKPNEPNRLGLHANMWTQSAHFVVSRLRFNPLIN